MSRRLSPHEERQAWRTLVAEARRVCRRPETAALGKLTRAARRAGAARVLEGEAVADNPFVQLQRLAARFSLLLGVERIRDVETLLALADRVGRAVGLEPGSAPEAEPEAERPHPDGFAVSPPPQAGEGRALPFRADIDG